MEDNAFDKLKSIVNSGNIPENLQKVLSNISSSNKNTNSSSSNSGISQEAINNLMAMLNSPSNDKSDNSTNSNENKEQNNSGIDFETIMKFKTIMDKMNSKEDPRTKLLVSLKPYLKESRKNKVDQYIQFFKMSQVIDIFSKSNGDDKS